MVINKRLLSPSTSHAGPEPADDYTTQLHSALDADEDEDDDDDDEGYGEFVYSGKDSRDSDEEVEEKEAGVSVRPYADEMASILTPTERSDSPTTEPPPIDEHTSEAGSTGTANGLSTKPSSIRNGKGKARETSSPDSSMAVETPDLSSDTFPGLTPSRSVTDSLASASFPRRPAAHPQISRLRSTSTQPIHPQAHPRIPSSSTQYSGFIDRRNFDSPATGGSSIGFDAQSRRSSTSNLPADYLNGNVSSSDVISPGTTSPPPGTTPARSRIPTDTFRWSSLKRISSRIYPPTHKGGVGFTPAAAAAQGLLGTPTVLAVSGIIAVGTSNGWVMVFDFGQNLRCVCGTEAIAKESGPVTALAISQDHTFIAVGHALGSIHLYALLKPSQPARSVPPTTLPLVLTGRKEGHLQGSKILHLGFVGARHTAIVSSDETGLAFYHSLGKVLMLASTDIIRMLGRYPDPASGPPSRVASPALNGKGAANGHGASGAEKPKKSQTVLDMASLPLGPSPHSSDSHSLVAILTPSKLVIVGLKPTPRTWWRATHPPAEATPEGSRNGVLSWFPSVAARDAPASLANGNGKKVETGEDPVLAFAWGKNVRIVQVRGEKGVKENGFEKEGPGTKVADLEFAEAEGFTCDSPVLALQWYSDHIIVVLTANHVEVYDTHTRQQIGRDPLDVRYVVSHGFHSSATDSTRPPSEDALAYSGSLKMHKRKLFLLSVSDLRAGAILSWADRILGLMQPGTILEAIELTTAYYLGQIDASTIALPEDSVARRDVVEPKLREILNASLDFVFSEDRLRDGSHNDGVAIQRLFEGLVGTCVRACLALGEVDWLFDELFERYERNGIETIFLDQIEPFVLSGSVHSLPPSVSQRLIAIHEERGQYEAAQRIIWHVDPEYLDINQALGLCQRQKLYDALIYVYTRSLHDFVAPIVELVVLVRRIQQHRKLRPRRIGDLEESGLVAEGDVEATVPDAYKVYAYLSQSLAGLSYPSKSPLPHEEGINARNAIYSFLFSGRTLAWPEKGGKAVLTSDQSGSDEPLYPYLRLLLRFDAEAMLDALDLAFEEPYLEDDVSGKPVTRQSIIDILLDVMSPESPDFSAVDRTFLHIFVARNLPKYPQFINLDSSVLHRILVGLAVDDDQSTTEDRQLASEYLLSSYTPRDLDEMVVLFERARFFRLLRSIYRGERRWAQLASTYLHDADIGADIFDYLRETLKLATRSTQEQQAELAATILDAIPSLIQAHESGLQETADLVDTFLPTLHADVIDRLRSAPWRQFAYLRYLLEPAFAGSADLTSPVKDRPPSTRLDSQQRLLYLRLLCSHEPRHVIQYLESDPLNMATESDSMKICEDAQVFDAWIWAIDQRGDTLGALDKVDSTLLSRTDLLVQSLLLPTPEEVDEDHGDDEDYGVPRRMFQATSTADSILEQISSISMVAIKICVQRAALTTRTTSALTGEDLWFRLLSALVATVRAVRAVSPAPPRPSDRSSSHRRISGASIIYHDDNPQPLSPRSSDILSSLIPTALSSLVSTTSTREVSFPNLMRRLIESNARSPAADRSYAEFKAIVTSMLDTYVFEGDLLEITSKISSQDLFEHVAELEREQEQGWRVGGELCDECVQPVWGPAGIESPPMSRSASVSMVVETLGLSGRPRMKKRPSLKGKEVDWADGAIVQEPQQILDPPRGIVVGRDSRVWHQSCHLVRESYRS